MQGFEESIVALQLLREAIKLAAPQCDLICQPVPLEGCVPSGSGMASENNWDGSALYSVQLLRLQNAA